MDDAPVLVPVLRGGDGVSTLLLSRLLLLWSLRTLLEELLARWGSLGVRDWEEPDGMRAAALGLGLGLLLALLLVPGKVGAKKEVRGVEIAGLMPGLLVPEAGLPPGGPRYM